MVLHNIKLVIRNLKRQRLYSFLSITGFSVGFAVSIFIALFIYNELSMDNCFPNSGNIVRVFDPKENNCSLDMTLTQDFKEKYPEIGAACQLQQISDMDISAKSDKNFTKFRGLISTTNDFFNIFPVKIIAASARLPFDGSESILITKSMAEILFPGEDPLGKSIVIWDFMKGQVTAVIEDFPDHSSIQANVLINAENKDFRLAQNCNNGRCWEPASHFLMLKPNSNREALIAKMNTLIPKDHIEIKSLGLQKLGDIYLSTPIDGNGNIVGNLPLLWIFLSVGIVILLLSVINFLNFYISLQYKKLKEIGIKKINGAGLGNLLRFSLVEVTVSILISIVLALILFRIFLPYANRLFERNLKAGWLLDPSLLFVLLTITGAIIVINSIAPIYILSKFNTSSFLTKLKVGGQQQIGRRVLTLIQLSASIVLLIVVFSLQKQVNYAKHADLGFNKEHLIRLNLPQSFKNQDALKQKLKEYPFCESVALSRGAPGAINLMMGDGKAGSTVMLKTMYVDEDFISTLGIQLKSGRSFLSGDIGNGCLLNEEAMKQYGWTDFEGQKFANGREGGYNVVGITNNFHVESMYNKIQPVCLLSAETGKHNELKTVSIMLAPGELTRQMAELNKVWKSFIPDEPMNYTFYDQHFAAMYGKDERLGEAIGLISIIALVLTFMGILGQVFQISLNRTKEIGIRKVNGATIADILADMNKEFLIWVFVSLVIAIPLAYSIIDKWLQSFAYRTQIGWWTYLIAGLIMLVTVAVTVTLQSWKAATSQKGFLEQSK
ncbi:MAG: ABC transporter permease [Mariniphaga sp.]